MRARRNETHRALLLIAACVIGADGEQSSKFSLAAGVWLQAHRVVTGDGHQHGFELLDHRAVSNGVGVVGIRMNIGKLRPCDWHHLDGGVELHRARAKRDHRAVKR